MFFSVDDESTWLFWVDEFWSTFDPCIQGVCDRLRKATQTAAPPPNFSWAKSC